MTKSIFYKQFQKLVKIHYYYTICKKIHFGKKGASDMAIYKNEAQRQIYINTIDKPMFWSKHIFWNKETWQEIINDTKRKLILKFFQKCQNIFYALKFFSNKWKKILMIFTKSLFWYYFRKKFSSRLYKIAKEKEPKIILKIFKETQQIYRFLVLSVIINLILQTIQSISNLIMDTDIF